MAEQTKNPPAPQPQDPPAPAAPAPAPAAPAGPVVHYKDGKLTRAGMEHVVRTGGSVIHDGRIINSADALPSEASLAGGDAAAEAAAMENINRQRAALDAQEAQLRASSAAAGKSPAKK